MNKVIMRLTRLPVYQRFGVVGLICWIVLIAIFFTLYACEYWERPDDQKSFAKAGVWFIECCTGIFAYSIGFSVFLYMIYCRLRLRLRLHTVSNKNIKPQDMFPFGFRSLGGVDRDGETIRLFDLYQEYMGKYFIIFFFPMDFSVDSSEVIAISKTVPEMANSQIEILGVTADSPLATRRWFKKNVDFGGFGTPPGFPILSDKDLNLSMVLGIAKNCGLPARATFIVDSGGMVRYSLAHRSNIGRSVTEVTRMALAFKHVDMTGEAVASGWMPGGEAIPTDFTKKLAYFLAKYGEESNKEESVEEDTYKESDDKNDIIEKKKENMDDKKLHNVDIHSAKDSSDMKEEDIVANNNEENKENKSLEAPIPITNMKDEDIVSDMKEEDAVADIKETDALGNSGKENKDKKSLEAPLLITGNE